MVSRLTYLVEVLEGFGVDQALIDKVIIDNYDKAHTKEFTVGDEIYRVLSPEDIDNELYDIAEDLFYDYEAVLFERISRSNDAVYLEAIIGTINVDQGTKAIAQLLDYEEMNNMTIVALNDDYKIFKS